MASPSLRGSFFRLKRIIFLVGGLVIAGTPFAQSRVYEDFVPAGSLHLGQVMTAAKRDDIIRIKPLYEAVKTTGMNDADVVDGTVVAVRIFCCGGITKESSSEVSNSLFLFVPKGVDAGIGDIVEFRVGHGWIKQGGISPAWFKPPSPETTGK